MPFSRIANRNEKRFARLKRLEVWSVLSGKGIRLLKDPPSVRGLETVKRSFCVESSGVTHGPPAFQPLPNRVRQIIPNRPDSCTMWANMSSQRSLMYSMFSIFRVCSSRGLSIVSLTVTPPNPLSLNSANWRVISSFVNALPWHCHQHCTREIGGGRRNRLASEQPDPVCINQGP